MEASSLRIRCRKRAERDHGGLARVGEPRARELPPHDLLERSGPLCEAFGRTFGHHTGPGLHAQRTQVERDCSPRAPEPSACVGGVAERNGTRGVVRRRGDAALCFPQCDRGRAPLSADDGPKESEAEERGEGDGRYEER